MSDMNHVQHTPSVDLDLLPVFEAVYEARSLSRAAERLATSQSAISHAVNRLRFVLRDELFVRQSRGVVPTPAADRIYAKLRGALAAIRESVIDTRGFDPRTSERRFVIAIAHPLDRIWSAKAPRQDCAACRSPPQHPVTAH